MAIRETLQKNSAAVVACLVVVIVICLAVVYSEVKSGRNWSGVGKTFYSDDDGKTWFLDDPGKGSPFDHQGKQACRALVYRCPGGGTPFVAYLTKYSDQQIAKDAEEMSHVPPGTASRLPGSPMHDIKKPGEPSWSSNPQSPSGDPPAPPCPGGGGTAQMVLPTDPDTGATN